VEPARAPAILVHQPELERKAAESIMRRSSI
jgi:hypothetical protein